MVRKHRAHHSLYDFNETRYLDYLIVFLLFLGAIVGLMALFDYVQKVPLENIWVRPVR